ncbi:hypothetical protein ATCC90586_007386 [Pythium insidiosum]|nr:hypothetical protein ATCC90586_007386 [Pythium insidiosum]
MPHDKRHNTDAQLELVEEIKLNAALHHPNIVSFIGAAWTTRADLQAIFEFVPGGDLRTWLEATPRTPWTRQKTLVALDVAYALAYLHSRQPSALVHRDVKSHNVLLTSTEGLGSSMTMTMTTTTETETAAAAETAAVARSTATRLTAKLCDFGVSRAQSSNHSMTTGVGTSRWLAPEVILGGGRYDTATRGHAAA